MAEKSWKHRPAPKATTITECARRYHAAALALSQTLGLPLAEVLAQHRESVTAIFIETSKCELRLPPGVPLPPLVTANGQAPEPPEPPRPVVVPPGVPCSGLTITGLKPNQLAMLIGKVTALSARKSGAWTALLTALQAERASRIECSRTPRPVLVPVEGDGHGG